MSWRSYTTDTSCKWVGEDSIFNLNHAMRWQAIWLGVGLLAVYWLLVPIVAGMIFDGIGSARGHRWVRNLWLFLFLPGVGSILFAFTYCRKFITRRWELEVRDGVFHYRGGITLTSELVEMLRLEAWVEAFGFEPKTCSWTMKLADIARIETSLTAEWKQVRRYGLSERHIPRDEYQAFLFIANGSRRVIATVHGGRETAATLAHSIRAWIEFTQQGGLAGVIAREQTKQARERQDFGEGFDL